MERKLFKESVLVNIILFLISLTFIIPLVYIVSISFSSEASIAKYGYKLFPTEFSLAAYKYVFANPKQLIDSYKITTLTSVVGTFLSVLLMSAASYPLSRKNFKARRVVTFFIFFTMLFGGGLIPTYILNTQYLKLGNTVWIYIFQGLVSGFYIIMIRTFFSDIPLALIESAKIDGASEFVVLLRIVIPLSTPVLATVGLFNLLARWNDWMTSLIYIRDQELYTLQFLLQRILRETEFVKKMALELPMGTELGGMQDQTPVETMKFALCIVAIGPMLLVFPFFQKYFARGLTVGAVKG